MPNQSRGLLITLHWPGRARTGDQTQCNYTDFTWLVVKAPQIGIIPYAQQTRLIFMEIGAA